MTISGWRPNAPSGAARHRVADATARVARLEDAERELERAAARSPGRGARVGCTRRSGVGRASRDRQTHRPARAELVEWSSRVRAHVFVAAGQLDSQRDRVIREASELGSMLLGEPLYGATPAQVRARVEAAAA